MLRRFLLLFVLVSFLVLATLPHIGKAQRARWTVLIYMDGDNDLEAAAIEDFLEMAAVGSSPEINIVVQFDRATESNPDFGYSSDYGDWTDARRFLIEKGMTPTPANASISLGEVNMGDPATLVDFVLWGAGTYPADHYFLDLWDHGIGWPGIAVDQGDFLTTVELGQTLSQIHSALGSRIDLLGNDACRMTLEILYELKDHTNFLVGSEKDEPIQGWPYDNFLAALESDPLAGPEEVGRKLVSIYVNEYTNNSAYSVSLSLVSSASMLDLVRKFNDYLVELNASLPLLQSQLINARDTSEHYESSIMGGFEYDLYHFTERTSALMLNPRLDRLAKELRLQINNTVVFERHWDNPSAVNGVRSANSHGLSLWFPDSLTDASYAQLALSKDSYWDEFLSTYRDGTPPSVPLEASALSLDVDDNGLNETLSITVASSSSSTVIVDLYADGLYVGGRRDDSGARPLQMNVTAPVPGSYVLYVYLYNDTKLLNVTSISGLNAEALAEITGGVTDAAGQSIIGATVILSNALSGALLESTTLATGYHFSFVYPTWVKKGDRLDISVHYQGSVTRFSISYDYSATPLRIDVQLRIVSQPPADGILWGVIAVSVALWIVLAVLLFLYLRRRPPSTFGQPQPKP